MKALNRFLRLEFDGKYINAFYQATSEFYNRLLDKVAYFESATLKSLSNNDFEDFLSMLNISNLVVMTDRLPTFLTLPDNSKSMMSVKNIETQEFIEHEIDEENRAGILQVEDESKRVGYIPANVNIFDLYGNLDESKVVFGNTPPQGAYTEYYSTHNNYLYVGTTTTLKIFMAREDAVYFLSLVLGRKLHAESWELFEELCKLTHINEHATIRIASEKPNIYTIYYHINSTTAASISQVELFLYYINRYMTRLIAMEE